MIDFTKVESLPNEINRIVLVEPGPYDQIPIFNDYNKEWQSNQKSPLLAVIDDGFDFLNSRYYSDDHSRFIAVWDQNNNKVIDDSEINKNSQHGNSLDTYNNYFQYPLKKRTHGSAVLQAATKQVSKAGPVHNGTPLLAVQIPAETASDASGGSLGAKALDALRWIFDVAATEGVDRPVVVNLSMGTDAGAHDGSSIFEEALDELLTLREVNTAIVVPAGNTGSKNGHLSKIVPGSAEFNIDWFIPSDDQTDSFLEIWTDKGAEITVSLTNPNGDTLESVVVGSCEVLKREGDVAPYAMVANMRQNTLSTKRNVVLLAIAATQPRHACHVLAPSGYYRVSIKNNSQSVTAVQAWLERDGAVYGRSSIGKQGFIVPAESSKHLKDGAKNTLNSIANGQHTIVVGAAKMPIPPRSAPEPVEYSGYSSTKPPILAPGDEGQHPAAQGLPVEETVGRDIYRIGGTSLAAAMVSRWLLAYLKQTKAPSNNTEIKKLMTRVAGGSPSSEESDTLPDWPPRIH